MRMNHRRHARYVGMLLLAMLLPVLAACGSGEQAGSPNVEQPASIVATDAPAASGDATAPAASGDAAQMPGTGPADAAQLAPPDQQLLRVQIPSAPASIDPAQAQDTSQSSVADQLFVGLTRLNKDLEAEGAVAESWEFNADNTQITFKLRDTTWSDGKPVTAQDFAYAWKRFLDPTTAAPYVSVVLDVIKGAAELNSTPISDTAKLDAARDNLGVTALDDKTLQVDFAISAPFFPSIASLANFAPVRQDVVEQFGDRWVEPQSLIGNGPFKLESYTQGSEMTFVPNENYYEGAPKLQHLVYKFFNDPAAAFAGYQADEVDITEVPPAEIRGIRDNPQFADQIVQDTQTSTYYYAFNATTPPFDDVKVRKAFAYAIDRKTLTEEVLSGVPQPAYSFIPPGIPGHLSAEEAGDAAQTFDPERAKQFLADAGFPNGQGFPEIRLAFNNNSAHSLIAERIQSDLKNNLGINITLDPREPSTYFNEVQQNPPPFFRLAWSSDYPDPYDWNRLVFGPDSTQNYGRWQNPKYTELVDQADKELDPDKRVELYKEAEKVLADDAGAAFIYWYGRFRLVKPWVKGLTYTPQDSSLGSPSYKDAQIVQH